MDRGVGKAVAGGVAAFLAVGVLCALYVVGQPLAALIPALFAGLWAFELLCVRDDPETFNFLSPPVREYHCSLAEAMDGIMAVLSDSVYGPKDDQWVIEKEGSDFVIASLTYLDVASQSRSKRGSQGKVERQLRLEAYLREVSVRRTRVQLEFSLIPLSMSYGSTGDVVDDFENDLDDQLAGLEGQCYQRVRSVRVVPGPIFLVVTGVLLLLFVMEVVSGV